MQHDTRREIIQLIHEKGELNLVLKEASVFSFCASEDTVSLSHLLSLAPSLGSYLRNQNLAEVDTDSNYLNVLGQYEKQPTTCTCFTFLARALDPLWSLNGITKEEVNNAQWCDSERTKFPKAVWGSTSTYQSSPEMIPSHDRV